MPTVAADLDAGSQSIQLTVTVFLAGLAFGQLIAGPLSDTLGRRRPLLAGLAIFTGSSVLCAVTPSAGLLIGLRAVQGLSGAAGVAVANAVVTDHFRGRAQARFLSRLVLVSGMAPIVAPLIGGQLLRFTSWRGVFVGADGPRRGPVPGRGLRPAREPAARAAHHRQPQGEAGDDERPVARLHLHGSRARGRPPLLGLLRLPDDVVVRLPGPVRRVAGAVQRSVQRQRGGDAARKPGEPSAAGALLAPRVCLPPASSRPSWRVWRRWA